jgi:hypothetical protein
MKILPLAWIALSSLAFADTSTPPSASFGTSAITVSQSSGEVRIPVKVSGPPLSDFFGTTVYTTAVQGTATWPRDFDSIYGSVKFVSGETSKFLIIGLPATSTFTGTRTFTVRLDSRYDYNIGSPSTVTITIKGSAVVEKVPPVITTTTKKLSGGRIQVKITARDSNGLKSTKKLIVKP